jgi:hypothetical protein
MLREADTVGKARAPIWMWDALAACWIVGPPAPLLRLAVVHDRMIRVDETPSVSIRIEGQVLEGCSSFYAKVGCPPSVVGLAERGQILRFLNDDILDSPDSQKRSAGAESLIGGFVESSGKGLLTIHDLASASPAETLAPLGAIVHSRDHLEESRIAFDYRARPGVVGKRDALKLMRTVELDA